MSAINGGPSPCAFLPAPVGVAGSITNANGVTLRMTPSECDQCFSATAPAAARTMPRNRRTNGETVGMLPAGMTVTVEEALLFVGFGSAVVTAAVTVAVFVTGPADEGKV